MSTGFYYHDLCRKHDMGKGHPESPARLDAILERLRLTGLDHALVWPDVQAAKIEDLCLAHDALHVDRIRSLHENLLTQDMGEHSAQLLQIDPDTWMNAHTWPAALHAAGAVLGATRAVMTGQMDNAFCAIRPPGHHAEKNQAMGFCFFNNIAIAVKYALQVGGIKRVAVIDFDVHHGNGTEDILAGDERVLMVGFYQHPLYPFKHHVPAAKNMKNMPVAAYSKPDDVKQLIEATWLPELDAFEPEMIFVSAGFDAHRDDDLGQMLLREADYAWITRVVLGVAKRHAQGRLVSCLEGGYNLQALGLSVEAHLRVLADMELR